MEPAAEQLAPIPTFQQTTAMFDPVPGLEALVAKSGDDPVALATLARLMRTAGKPAEALDLADRAWRLAPDNPEVRSLAGDVLSTGVPAWHFGIVRDRLRNQAYEAALRRAITPGSRVLEVGAGSGLLAMMAARAGAQHVHTCEMEPAVALAARKVIEHNGLAGRVTVLAKHSRDVTLDDIGGPADVLVSEIVSNDMVTEDALPALEDVMARLVRPGGAIIPATGEVRVALGFDARLESRRMGMVSGFDLTPFNCLASPFYQIPVGSPALSLRSAPERLFGFDFRTGGPWSWQQGEVELSATGGPANGIVQWIKLGMDDEGSYDNMPAPGADSCWAAIFHPFPAAITQIGGKKINVFGHHDRVSLRIWPGALL